jgi:hypothetical protein
VVPVELIIINSWMASDNVYVVYGAGGGGLD